MSAVGDVVTGIVAACVAADLPVEVWDGQAYDPEGNFLAIGWAGDDIAGIEFSSTVFDAGQASSYEVIDVACILGLHDGDWRDAQAIRTDLLRVYNNISSALRNTAALTDLLMRPARVDRGQILQQGDEGGVEGTLTFNVHCEAQSVP